MTAEWTLIYVFIYLNYLFEICPYAYGWGRLQIRLHICLRMIKLKDTGPFAGKPRFVQLHLRETSDQATHLFENDKTKRHRAFGWQTQILSASSPSPTPPPPPPPPTSPLFLAHLYFPVPWTGFVPAVLKTALVACWFRLLLTLLVGRVASQQHASVSQG